MGVRGGFRAVDPVRPVQFASLTAPYDQSTLRPARAPLTP